MKDYYVVSHGYFFEGTYGECVERFIEHINKNPKCLCGVFIHGSDSSTWWHHGDKESLDKNNKAYQERQERESNVH